MDNIPDIYNLETVEQLRTFADGLRMRLVDVLSQRAMTAKQLATLLGEPPSRTHYHLRELERVGLVRLVETREKGGILEKYYRAVARNFSIPDALLRAESPDDGVAEMGRMVRAVSDNFLRAFSESKAGQPGRRFTLSVSSVWLTQEEYRELEGRIQEFLDTYKALPAEGERREYSVALLAHAVHPSVDPAEGPPSREDVRVSAEEEVPAPTET